MPQGPASIESLNRMTSEVHRFVTSFCVTSFYLTSFQIALASLPPLLPVMSFNSTSEFFNTTDWAADKYPNPRRDLEACGQEGRLSFVCDPNGILEPEAAIFLDEMIEELTEFKCPCEELGQPCPKGRGGYHIGIALAPSLRLSDGVEDSEVERDLEVQRFALYLRTRKWHLGFCNNDAVVAVVPNYRKVYTSTGSIARNVLTSECVHLAEEKAQEYFADGNYTAGLMVMLAEFKSYFSEKNTCSVRGPLVSHWPIEAILGVVLGMFAFAIVCVVTMTRFCTGAGASGSSSRTHYYTSYRESRNSLKKRPPEADIEEECEMIPINEVKSVDV